MLSYFLSPIVFLHLHQIYTQTINTRCKSTSFANRKYDAKTLWFCVWYFYLKKIKYLYIFTIFKWEYWDSRIWSKRTYDLPSLSKVRRSYLAVSGLQDLKNLSNAMVRLLNTQDPIFKKCFFQQKSVVTKGKSNINSFSIFLQVWNKYALYVLLTGKCHISCHFIYDLMQ